MMPLTIANTAHVAALDIYSGSLVMVDAINHSSSKSYPVGYIDEWPSPWTRIYMHDCLDCNGIQMPKIGQLSLVSFINNVNATYLWCQENPPLRTVNVSGSTAMVQLNIADGGGIRSINIKGAPIVQLYARNNELSSVDLSDVDSGFAVLQLHDNKLTSLNVTASTNATDLQCYRNQLTSFNITSSGPGPHGPTGISCFDNLLSTLDVRMCGKLSSLSCYSNLLTELYISGTTQLINLLAYDNQLTQTSVDNILTALTQSGMSNIGTLDLTGGTNAAPSIVGQTAITYLTTGPNSWVITTN